jgi:3-carboxy-cis,cis-muconate cycloisomerase
MIEDGLLSGMFSRGPVAAEVCDRAVLQAMLDVEAALVRALAGAGLATDEAAAEIASAADASGFDLAAIGRSAGDTGTPVVGMLEQLRARLGNEGAAYLHRGATSQDVVDTALMLVAKRAMAPLLDELARAADACADLAERHRTTLAPGRTLLQQALPVTFGLKAAGWLTGLDGARRQLADVRRGVLAVQLGGAVGTLAALGDRGLEVGAGVAAELGLDDPPVPWHTQRLRPARLACALGAAVGVMGKIGRDVALLAQTEVAEATEGGEARGASSAMPHKRNPVGAIAIAACAQRAPGLVATILGAMVQEHERAAGAWQSEWEPLLELLRLAGSAAATLADLLAGLQVDAERMRSNLGATGELLMSESVATALTESLGRTEAQRLVTEATQATAGGRSTFRDALLALPEVRERLGVSGVTVALDPSRYLGVCEELISRAVAAHHQGRRGRA